MTRSVTHRDGHPTRRSDERHAGVRLRHIKDLHPDPVNRRTHTPRNIGLITDALHQVGAARSIVIDEDDVVLAGNGVIEAAADAGITKLRVIEADGHEIIAVRRRNLSQSKSGSSPCTTTGRVSWRRGTSPPDPGGSRGGARPDALFPGR